LPGLAAARERRCPVAVPARGLTRRPERWGYQRGGGLATMWVEFRLAWSWLDLAYTYDGPYVYLS
jgi:hypothetical protein